MGLRNRTLFVEEKCFFITTTCYNKYHLLKTIEVQELIASSLNFLCNKYSAHIFAYVVMPNHLHLIIYFEGDNRLSDFMRDFKKFTSVKIRQIIEKIDGTDSLENIRFEHRSQKFKVWSDRFDDVYIRNKDLFQVKFDYIHNNPLQEHWKLADKPEDYVYSSAAYYYGTYQGIVKVRNYIDFIW